MNSSEVIVALCFVPAIAFIQGHQVNASELQTRVDKADSGETIDCDAQAQIELSSPLVIRKAITLKGLNAALPRGLGNTSLVVVESSGVTICDCEFHGNYDSVPQKDRAPLVRIQQGDFKVERCTFYDGSKDGVNVTPPAGDAGRDIVGGSIRDIKAFRMGRDAVSISGGNTGLKVRNVTVDNVRLERGYHRGAVEVSDGTDNVTVRNVYAEDAVYALDVQDHGKGAAPNTNVTIENVEAVRCKHILRTANSARGHADLTLRNLTGRECALPLQISHTRHVRVEQLTILAHTDEKLPPIRLEKCDDVELKKVVIQSAQFADKPVKEVKCDNVTVTNLTIRP
jgi:hypothetical protein